MRRYSSAQTSLLLNLNHRSVNCFGSRDNKRIKVLMVIRDTARARNHPFPYFTHFGKGTVWVPSRCIGKTLVIRVTAHWKSNVSTHSVEELEGIMILTNENPNPPFSTWYCSRSVNLHWVCGNAQERDLKLGCCACGGRSRVRATCRKDYLGIGRQLGKSSLFFENQSTACLLRRISRARFFVACLISSDSLDSRAVLWEDDLILREIAASSSG